MKKLVYILFFVLYAFYGLMGQGKSKIIEKHFVKQNKVLVRIVPESKQVFDKISTNAIKVTRYNYADGKLSNEVVIHPMLKTYWATDTVKWMQLFQKDKNKMAFVYNALFQNKANAQLSPQKKAQQEKMVYDLLLLSCNFDADVAKACGLLFIDSTINNTNTYVYKLAVYTNSMSVTTSSLLNVTIDASQLSTNKKIIDLGIRSKYKISTLKWKAVDYRNDYSAYNIERSEDSSHFETVNTKPVILLRSQFEKNKEFIFYNDTMPIANKIYFYRIRGINFFAEESEPSNMVKSYSTPAIKSIAIIDSIHVIANRAVSVKWRMENTLETGLLKKYVLLRANKENGKYTSIFESETNLKFVDLKPLPSNFYKVGAITFNNDTLFSYSRVATLIDTIAPIPPIGLKASVDKKGVVTIQWKKNKEADLQGYKLFKANTLKEEFVQINNKFIKDTFYIDKLNLKTLSKKIYYTLAACDNNFNTSLRCLAIEVKRPDTIPPPNPILQALQSKHTGIQLSYILSKTEDLAKHSIFRKSNLDTNFVGIKLISTNDSSNFFIDTTAQCGQTYTYHLLACDEDANCATSKNLMLLYETGFRKKLTTINYVVDRVQKNVRLNWDYNEKEIEKFILYRAKENEPLSIIKTVAGTTLSYVDATPNIGNIYEYRIKAVLFNGAESIISDPIKVIY